MYTERVLTVELGIETKRESVWPYITRASVAAPNSPLSNALFSISMARRQDCTHMQDPASIKCSPHPKVEKQEEACEGGGQKLCTW